MGQSATPVLQTLSTRKEQLLTLITGLQQQVAILLQQNRGARVEVAKPLLFSRRMKEVNVFINTTYLYLSIKIIGELEATKITWVLSYVQKRVAEVQKDNLLDELLKEESETKTAKELFSKMKNKFGEIVEKEQKIEQLRTIEQERRIYNKYVQEFKKMA